MDELEKSERQAMEKYNNMKAELMEAQGELARVKVNNKQKDQEVEDIKRVSSEPAATLYESRWWPRDILLKAVFS